MPGTWTQDIEWACRFSRREDAQTVLTALGGSGRVAEHAYVAAPLCEPVTWEPTSDYRLRNTYNRVSGAPRDFRLVRRWRSSSGAEEWRDVEVGQ